MGAFGWQSTENMPTPQLQGRVGKWFLISRLGRPNSRGRKFPKRRADVQKALDIWIESMRIVQNTRGTNPSGLPYPS